jgi:hypothetical protein
LNRLLAGCPGLLLSPRSMQPCIILVAAFFMTLV